MGGKVSLEMQMPKLLWLKKNKVELWKGAKAFYDLADYLTFKATGSEIRSLCTLVCKWCFRGLPDENGPHGYDQSFLQSIGLQEYFFTCIRKRTTILHSLVNSGFLSHFQSEI